MGQQLKEHPDYPYIEAILNRDNATIRKFYERFFTSSTSFIHKFGGKGEDAEDVFQEAIILLFRKAKSGDLALTGSLGGYLQSICKFIWMNQRKKKSNSEVTIHDGMTYMDEEGIEEELNQREKDKLYRKKFQQLGQDCKKVLTMFFEGLSMKRIADEMEYSSVQYAKKRKFQCKSKLVELIQQDQIYRELVNL